jgi:dienelactone hydrolase
MRRKYVLQTLPEVFMPFYMLIPDHVDANMPSRAMIVIPAHGANKNTVCGVAETPEEQEKIFEAPRECYGREFAQQGYVVFCPDPPGYGERVEPLNREDTVFDPSQKRSSLDSSCKDLSQTAEAFGLSLTALEVHDLQKLLDFACGCEEVKQQEDHALIGCAGFSGGGQYAMWLAALDARICTAVVSGYIHSYYDSLLYCHMCPCNYAPDLWTLGDISDICSMIAPRPLFVENGTEDVENGPNGISGPQKQVEKIRNAYAVFHAEDQLVHYTPHGAHQWYGGCYEFVKQHL